MVSIIILVWSSVQNLNVRTSHFPSKWLYCIWYYGGKLWNRNQSESIKNNKALQCNSRSWVKNVCIWMAYVIRLGQAFLYMSPNVCTNPSSVYFMEEPEVSHCAECCFFKSYLLLLKGRERDDSTGQQWHHSTHMRGPLIHLNNSQRRPLTSRHSTSCGSKRKFVSPTNLQ